MSKPRDYQTEAAFWWSVIAGSCFGWWQQSVAAGVFMAMVLYAAIGESIEHRKGRP